MRTGEPISGATDQIEVTVGGIRLQISDEQARSFDASSESHVPLLVFARPTRS